VWSEALSDPLIELKVAVDVAKQEETVLTPERLAAFKEQYRKILEAGEETKTHGVSEEQGKHGRKKQPKAKNLLGSVPQIPGRDPGIHKGFHQGSIDREIAEKRIADLSSRFGLEADLDTKVYDLPVGLKQRLEIIKLLYRGAEIIILDEPTAALSPQGTEELLDVIRDLKNEGKTIIFISHKASRGSCHLRSHNGHAQGMRGGDNRRKVCKRR